MPERAMSDEEAVLAVNEAFYRAFANHDVAAMDALWSRETPVACIHPGWNALVGREAVMESWTAILTAPGSPQIRCEEPRAFVLGAGAYVICREVLAQQVLLVATNVFAREPAGWRMVHHHAGPAGQSQRPDRDSERPPGPLH